MSKIKYFLESRKGKDIMTIIIIILVGIISFQLGRLSMKSSNKFNIENESLTSISLKGEESIEIKDLEFKEIDLNGRNYFASSMGKKYYPFGCSVGKSIKEENKIYFNTKEEAEEKGYTLSSSCNID